MALRVKNEFKVVCTLPARSDNKIIISAIPDDTRHFFIYLLLFFALVVVAAALPLAACENVWRPLVLA